MIILLFGGFLTCHNQSQLYILDTPCPMSSASLMIQNRPNSTFPQCDISKHFSIVMYSTRVIYYTHHLSMFSQFWGKVIHSASGLRFTRCFFVIYSCGGNRAGDIMLLQAILHCLSQHTPLTPETMTHRRGPELTNFMLAFLSALAI